MLRACRVFTWSVSTFLQHAILAVSFPASASPAWSCVCGPARDISNEACPVLLVRTPQLWPRADPALRLVKHSSARSSRATTGSGTRPVPRRRDACGWSSPCCCCCRSCSPWGRLVNSLLPDSLCAPALFSCSAPARTQLLALADERGLCVCRCDLSRVCRLRTRQHGCDQRYFLLCSMPISSLIAG